MHNARIYNSPISRLSISPSNISAVSGSPQEAGTVFVQVPPLHGQNNSDFQQCAPFMQHPAHNQTVPQPRLAAPYPDFLVVQVSQTIQPTASDQSRQTTAPSIDDEDGIATAQPGGINLLRQDSSGGRTTPSNGEELHHPAVEEPLHPSMMVSGKLLRLAEKAMKRECYHIWQQNIYSCCTPSSW